MKEFFKKIKSEKAVATIVEATIVFPVVFFTVCFMMLLGNAYFQMAKIETAVTTAAIEGAARCTDPFHSTVTSNKDGDGNISVPSTFNDIEPYRYILNAGGKDSNISAVEADLKSRLDDIVQTSGFFLGMTPDVKYSEVKYNNHFFYATLSAEVKYEITIPMKLLGEKEFSVFSSSARAEVAVNDPADFILNTDMVIDYVESSEVGQNIIGKVTDAMAKVREFLGLS